MLEQFHIFKAVIYPQMYFSNLVKDEKKRSIWIVLSVVLLFSAIITMFSSYYGVGTEPLAIDIEKITTGAYSWKIALFGIGQIIGSLIFPVLYLFIASFAFWYFCAEQAFRPFIFVNIAVIIVQIIGSLFALPFRVLMGLDAYTSPFSLGVLVQYITKNAYIVHFFGGISLFHLWGMVIQVIALKIFTNKSNKFILIVVIGVNLFLLLFMTLIIELDLYKLF